MTKFDSDPFKPISNQALYAVARGNPILSAEQKDEQARDQEVARRKGRNGFIGMNGEAPVIRIRTVAQGLMLAEEWGLFVDQLKPWEKKTRVLPVLDDSRRTPIDKEDAAIRANGGNPIRNIGIVGTRTVTPEMEKRGADLGMSLPIAGTKIEVSKEVANELAQKIAEADTDNPRSGEKVAALSALLGATIAETQGKTYLERKQELAANDR